MSSKKVVSSKQSVDTKYETRTDGATVKTVTTTTVSRYDDGTTSTETSSKITVGGGETKPDNAVSALPKPIEMEPYKEKVSKPSELSESVSKLHVSEKPATASGKVKTSSSSDTKSVLKPDEKFKAEALTAHNKYRKIHCSPPLVLNEYLCQLAQMQAKKVASKDSMSRDITPGAINYGESRFETTSAECSGNRPVDLWYSGVTSYNFNNPGFQKGTASFMHVIWKATKELGIGKATSRSGKTYAIAIYNPGGLNKGEYANNVLRPATLQK